MRKILSLLLFANVVFWGTVAHVEEVYALDGEYTLGAGVNSDFSFGSDIYSVGGWAFFQYCVSDGFHINVDLGAGVGFDDSVQSLVIFDLYHLRAGTIYAIDILEWVPYLGVNAILYATSDRERFNLGPVAVGLDLSLGLDYRRWTDGSLGFELTYQLVFTDRERLPDFFGLALYYAWQSDPF